MYRIGVFLFATIVYLLLVGCGGGNKNNVVVIEGFSWTRTISIERVKTFREEGWEIPKGGRMVSQRLEVHHTEPDTCNGPYTGTDFQPHFGFHACQKEIKLPKYTYQIGRWVKIRTVYLSGDGHEPIWPDPHLRGGERAGPRTESYRARVKTTHDGTVTVDCPESQWKSLIADQIYHYDENLKQIGERIASEEEPSTTVH